MQELIKNTSTLSRNFIKRFQSELDVMYSFNYKIFFPIFTCHETTSQLFDLEKSIFYNINSDFSIDKKDLLKKLKKEKTKNKILYIVHYFGLKTDNSFIEIINYCKKNNIIIFEDCGVTFGTKYKNKYLGTFGDLGIFSFRKYLFTKTGSSCFINNENFSNIIKKQNHNKKKSDYKKIIDFSLQLEINNLKKGKTLDIINKDLLKNKKYILNLDNSIGNLIGEKLDDNFIEFYKNYDWNLLKKNFINKYNLLFEGLQHNKNFILTEIDNNSFPLIFPIKLNITKNSGYNLCSKLRKFLEKNGIFTRGFWSIPKEIEKLFLNQYDKKERKEKELNMNTLRQNYIFISLVKDFDNDYYKNIIFFLNTIDLKKFIK